MVLITKKGRRIKPSEAKQSVLYENLAVLIHHKLITFANAERKKNVITLGVNPSKLVPATLLQISTDCIIP